jgi:hypothetical protein
VLNALGERDRQELQSLLGWYINYRFSNPTGHYDLALSSSQSRFLALRLKDVARAAPEGHQWINIIHDMYSSTMKTSSSCGPPEGWHGTIPTAGSLSVDFVQLDPPPPSAIPIADVELAAFLAERCGAPMYIVQQLLEEGAAGRGRQEEGEGGAQAGQAAGGASSAPRSASITRSSSQLPDASSSVSKLGAAPSQQRVLNMRSSGLVHGAGVAASSLVSKEKFAREAELLAAFRREWRAVWSVRCSQVLSLVMPLFSAAPHRVEVVVALWAALVDRENMWTLMQVLQVGAAGLALGCCGSCICLLRRCCSSAHSAALAGCRLWSEATVCAAMHQTHCTPCHMHASRAH